MNVTPPELSLIWLSRKSRFDQPITCLGVIVTEETHQKFEEIRWKLMIEQISTEKLRALLQTATGPEPRLQAELDRRTKRDEFLAKPGMVDDPIIEVRQDYNGYFERLVRQWLTVLKDKGLKARHKKIIVDAGPWRPDAVKLESDGEGVLEVDFYSPLRTSFGSLSGEAQEEIIEKWL